MVSASCTRPACNCVATPATARSRRAGGARPSVAAVANGGGPIAGAMLLTNGPS